VVRPRNWDEYGSSVKTDARDARQLCGHLDRYLAGNDQALCVVRVLSLEQEQERALSRQRETLAKEHKRLQNVGTSSGLYHGVEVPANWWKPKTFAQLCVLGAIQESDRRGLPFFTLLIDCRGSIQ
jgi:hypothetical protein